MVTRVTRVGMSASSSSSSSSSSLLCIISDDDISVGFRPLRALLVDERTVQFDI